MTKPVVPDKQACTPGPWATSRDAVPDWHTQITVYAESDGKRIATVFETEANARLIAAAPEMRAFLETIANYRTATWNENAEQQRSAFALSARELLASIDGV